MSGAPAPGGLGPLHCENPRRPGLLRLLVRLSLALSVPAALASVLAAFGLYVHAARDLPALYDAEAYTPPGVTRFFARDGRLLAEMTTERRVVVPLDRMPRFLLEAFLAAEDQRFFEHGGLDLRGIARAALANYRAGHVVEGASTITQQLCKTLVGNERSFERKLREAILARRLESRLSKLEILYLYLNQIYLGHGAHGVQAAARVYFDKDVSELSLAEAAMLAGLPPRPSTLNPALDLPGSKARQRYVLDRMVEEGFIDKAAADGAFAAPLTIAPGPPDLLSGMTPAFSERVRRELQANYGADALNREAFDVWLTVDADWQRAGEQAVKQGLWALGERQGYVGPLARDTDAALAERLAARYAGLAALESGREYLARVLAVDRQGAQVAVGSLEARLPLDQMAFAMPYDEAATRNGARLADATAALRPGDLVLVRAAALPPATPPRVRLSQTPKVEAALLALDAHAGEVRALVGGYDFDRSEYDRVSQGCRQPGSAFKPLVYSRALDTDYTLATLLSDTPLTEFDSAHNLLWKPRNFEGAFEGDVLLYRAFARSLNLPAIRTLDHVGYDAAVIWARRLGLTTPMYPDRTLVLGSNCVYPEQLVRAYAAFALRGERARTSLVSRVLTRRGEVLEDRTFAGDAFAPSLARADALLRAWQEPRERLMDARSAYLTTAGLKAVVDMGTAAPARALGHPAAGKTGTTDAYDAWFVGFTEQLVTGVWVGSDRNRRRLGDGETGGHVALPIWLDFMRAALRDVPPRDFMEQPPPGIVFQRIDAASGKLAAAGRPSLNLPFKEGTVPVEAAPAGGAFDRRDVDVVEGRF